MADRVAIVGLGYTQFRSISPDVSYREMIFEAATRAYRDAGIEPKEVDSFVALSEDYLEGTSIFDEYVPDQLGAVLKPVHTVCADAIAGLGSAYMQIKTGMFDLVVVEAHSKASNIVRPEEVELMAYDPVYYRPLGLHPKFLAGLEMRRFMYETGTSEQDCARVVVKNRRNALRNPLAAYPADIVAADVLASDYLAEPLRELDIARPADGAVVFVLAAEEVARGLTDKPVWIRGIGWAQDTPNIETRPLGRAGYAELAAAMAYRMAAIRTPYDEIDFAEVDDTFSYKELQHLEALGLARPGEAARLLEEGVLAADGELPVNVSGGSIGCGHLHEASGLQRVLEVALQLRREAGGRQLLDAHTGLAQSWRGLPTATGGVIILSDE